jgi:hypothetical protein
MNPKLTREAQQLWDAIPHATRLRLLNNVWCANCAKATGIGEISGNVEKGDLILRGVCTRCGGEVARLIETD